MKTHTAVATLLATLTLGASAQKGEVAAAKLKAARPQVEVCFVLDATGSMSGLIEGAKQKIWSIANDLTDADPSPDLKIGLVAYRDRSDDYITKKFALTDDLDAVYENLMGFAAAGGGDGPESVNQGLHEAVADMDWSADTDTLKIIFLVGDFPPHMDYANDIKYPAICKTAVKKDIIINTVQCGSHGPTTPIWKEIAHLSEGTYAAIAQEGGMAAIDTPVDARIAKLSRAINGTVIAYGNAAQQRGALSKLAAADAAPAAATASRQAYFSKKLAGKAISGREDLVAEFADGEVDLDDVKSDKLPEEFKKMSKDELATAVKERSEKRTELQGEMKKLVAERNAFVKKELAKRKAAGEEAGFDAEIRRAVKKQGAKKGIDYKG